MELKVFFPLRNSKLYSLQPNDYKYKTVRQNSDAILPYRFVG